MLLMYRLQSSTDSFVGYSPAAAPGTSTFPVIVTSYEVVMADIKFLVKYHYKCIIVDEGHRLKNFECRLLRELRTLGTDMKLLLTGEGWAYVCID